MREDNRRVLKLLVEKAQKLRDFDFAKHVALTGLGFHMTRSEDGWNIEFGLPDIVQRDAFVLTLRLFLQNNEPYSFVSLHQLIDDTDFSEEWRNETAAIRREYFDYLNRHSDYTVELFDGHPSRDEMLRAVLYGGLAHTNDEKEMQKFENWTCDDIRASLLMQEFTAILLQLQVLINRLCEISEKELAK